MSRSTITFGGVQYITYASIAEADAWLNVDPQYRDTWRALQDEDKGYALIAATRELDTKRWEGVKLIEDQANEWFRAGATDTNGNAIAEDAIPQEVERACIVLACNVVIDPEGFTTPDQAVKSVSVPGKVSIEYRGEVRGPNSTGYPDVDRLIRPLLASAQGAVGQAFNNDGTDAFANSYAGTAEGLS